MEELLSLSKAARLANIGRGALQKHIQAGELATFEGKIAVADLLLLYPETKLNDASMLEHVAMIKAQAQPGKGREHETTSVLPAPEVLMARLTAVNQELIAVKRERDHYKKLLAELTHSPRES